MYSEKIILANIAEFGRREGWEPEYHTREEVLQFDEDIKKITNIDYNSKGGEVKLTRTVTEKYKNEIRQKIRNEQVLCSLDCGYWETNFVFVCDEEGKIFKFKPRLSQRIFNSVVAGFDARQVSIELLILKARQTGMCLDPETKVLTADLRWVPIKDIQIGDELVAVEEGQTEAQVRADWSMRTRERNNGKKRPRQKQHVNRERKMTTCKVEAKWESYQIAFEITLASGAVLICSPGHRWLARVCGAKQPIWRQARHIAIGDEIRYVTRPWGPSEYEDGWFAGVADGEGSFRARDVGGCELTIAQRLNCVFERAKAYLDERGFTFHIDNDERIPEDSSKFGRDPVAKLCVNRMDELFRIIGKTRPSRFIGKRFWEGKCMPGKKSGKGWDAVTGIKMLAHRNLVDLQTSTRTFIAEGFVSHNSTQTAIKFMHRMLFVPHTQAIMASVKHEHSQHIKRIQDTIYDNCPWWLIPGRAARGGFDNGSILAIQSGMQATGLAQGRTPTLAHLSEIADYPDPKKTIEEGLMRAMHISSALFLVLEGTGGGNTGWLADKWRAAKSDFAKGDERLCPVFISWPCCPEIYPKAGFIEKFPVPEGFYGKRVDATKKMVTRSEAFIRNTPYLASMMGRNWEMPIEQQWFWQWNYLQAVKTHSQKTWLAQMPCDDFEALVGEHDSVFDPEIMAEVESHVYELQSDEKVRKQPLKAYAITGDSIEEEFYPSAHQIDDEEPVIRVEWTSHIGKKYVWEMIPLREVNEDKEIETFDKLLVYEEPKDGSDYSCGIDTAYGLGEEDEDRTVVSIWKNGFGLNTDDQVCELTSNRLNSAQVVGFAACAAAWYSASCKDWRGVKFAIEQITGPGDTCQNQLKIMGFNHHHKPRRYDSNKIKDESKRKLGWYSTGWSVPMLMTSFINAVNGGLIRPKSKWLIEEMRTLERHITTGGKTKMEHRSGQHDDRVRAAAQAFFTVHDLDDLAERAQQRRALPVRKRVLAGAGVCKSNLVTVSEDEEWL